MRREELYLYTLRALRDFNGWIDQIVLRLPRLHRDAALDMVMQGKCCSSSTHVR